MLNKPQTYYKNSFPLKNSKRYIFTMVILSIIIFFLIITKLSVGKFKLSDYKEDINFFCNINESIINSEYYNKNYGTVDNAKKAKEIAEVIWIEIYGIDVKKQKPYSVFYDNVNQAWLICGNLPLNNV